MTGVQISGRPALLSSLFHVSLVSVYTLLLPEIYGFIYLSPLLTNAREARNKLRAAGASRRETRRSDRREKAIWLHTPFRQRVNDLLYVSSFRTDPASVSDPYGPRV